MAEYNYEVQVIEKDSDGSVRREFTLAGPHDSAVNDPEGVLRVQLTHLPPDTGDPDKVRLALTLTENH